MDQNKQIENQKIWQRIAVISAVFGFIICVLVIANYFQINRYDPVQSEIINALVDRLNDTPNDEQLRSQIREMDLLARKAYFTNQWQIKTGGYLLLLSIGIIVLAYQVMSLNRRQQVIPNPDTSLDLFGVNKKAQKGIIYGGSAIVVLAGVLVFLTNQELNTRFAGKLAKETKVIEPKTEQPKEVLATNIEETKVLHEPDTIENNESTVQELTTPKEKIGAKEEIVKSEPEPETEAKVKPETVKNEVEPKPTTKSNIKNNFPGFRGYGGLGIVHNKNIPTDWDGPSGKNIKWKAKIPVHGYNAPIIWGDKLFLTGANASVREVYCYNRLSGDMLWQTAITGIEGSPAKMPKTTDDTGLAAPTMATDGERVYAIFATGDVVSLTMDGAMVWGVNLGVPQNHYGHSSSLYVFKDKLIVQYDHKGGAKVLALDTKSGKSVWSTTRDVKVSWASPIIINQETEPEIILAADPYVASYNPDTGAENWKIDCIFGEVGPSAAYTDGMVFALNEYATLAAIKLGANPEVVWEGDMYLSDVPSPVAANGLLIVATSYGAVVCHDAKTGEILWEQEFGNNIYASPMLVGDLVYLLDMQGIMHIFKMSRTFEKVATPKLGESSVCTPAFADGYVYIRAGDNLYAIGD